MNKLVIWLLTMFILMLVIIVILHYSDRRNMYTGNWAGAMVLHVEKGNGDTLVVNGSAALFRYDATEDAYVALATNQTGLMKLKRNGATLLLSYSDIYSKDVWVDYQYSRK